MKKILALILAVLMVLPIVIACQKPTDEPADTTGAQTDGPTETDDPFADNVPEFDFGEREFLITAPEPNGYERFDREEENADSINDAIYSRNRQLEGRFNITITAVNNGYTDSQASYFTDYAMAGVDIVDLIGIGFYQSGKPMITSGYAMKWNDVPYINLDKAWWNKSVTETLNIFDNYYYLSGDVNWGTMCTTMAIFFNKEVAADYVNIVGDLYETVRQGDWTQDMLLNLAKQIARDNGDSVWDENDTYGLLQHLHTMESYVYGANYQTVYMTDDGPVMNINTEKMSNLVNFAYSLLCENNISFITEDGELRNSIFFDNRALFYNGDMNCALNWRSYDTDFGIIPLPKYDKEQEQYVSYSDQWGLVCCLPCTATNLERTGAILEAMAALSRKLIVPAYYDKTLLGKIKRDNESEEMLDIIYSNILYDMGITFCTDLAYIPLRACINGRNKNLTSWYKTFQKKLEKNYQEIYDYVKANTEA